MSFLSKKIKEPKRTQVIVKDLSLDELIKDEIIEELKNKFSEDGEIVTTFIRFHIIPKANVPEQIKTGEGKKGEIIITPIDSTTLEHPSPMHIKDKVVVITSNKNIVLEKFLK